MQRLLLVYVVPKVDHYHQALDKLIEFAEEEWFGKKRWVERLFKSLGKEQITTIALRVVLSDEVDCEEIKESLSEALADLYADITVKVIDVDTCTQLGEGDFPSLWCVRTVDDLFAEIDPPGYVRRCLEIQDQDQYNEIEGDKEGPLENCDQCVSNCCDTLDEVLFHETNEVGLSSWYVLTKQTSGDTDPIWLYEDNEIRIVYSLDNGAHKVEVFSAASNELAYRLYFQGQCINDAKAGKFRRVESSDASWELYTCWPSPQGKLCGEAGACFNIDSWKKVYEIVPRSTNPRTITFYETCDDCLSGGGSACGSCEEPASKVRVRVWYDGQIEHSELLLYLVDDDPFTFLLQNENVRFEIVCSEGGTWQFSTSIHEGYSFNLYRQGGYFYGDSEDGRMRVRVSDPCATYSGTPPDDLFRNLCCVEGDPAPITLTYQSNIRVTSEERGTWIVDEIKFLVNGALLRANGLLPSDVSGNVFYVRLKAIDRITREYLGAHHDIFFACVPPDSRIFIVYSPLQPDTSEFELIEEVEVMVADRRIMVSLENFEYPPSSGIFITGTFHLRVQDCSRYSCCDPEVNCVKETRQWNTDIWYTVPTKQRQKYWFAYPVRLRYFSRCMTESEQREWDRTYGTGYTRKFASTFLNKWIIDPQSLLPPGMREWNVPSMAWFYSANVYAPKPFDAMFEYKPAPNAVRFRGRLAVRDTPWCGTREALVVGDTHFTKSEKYVYPYFNLLCSNSQMQGEMIFAPEDDSNWNVDFRPPAPTENVPSGSTCQCVAEHYPTVVARFSRQVGSGVRSFFYTFTHHPGAADRLCDTYSIWTHSAFDEFGNKRLDMQLHGCYLNRGLWAIVVREYGSEFASGSRVSQVYLGCSGQRIAGFWTDRDNNQWLVVLLNPPCAGRWRQPPSGGGGEDQYPPPDSEPPGGEQPPSGGDGDGTPPGGGGGDQPPSGGGGNQPPGGGGGGGGQPNTCPSDFWQVITSTQGGCGKCGQGTALKDSVVRHYVFVRYKNNWYFLPVTYRSASDYQILVNAPVLDVTNTTPHEWTSDPAVTTLLSELDLSRCSSLPAANQADCQHVYTQLVPNHNVLKHLYYPSINGTVPFDKAPLVTFMMFHVNTVPNDYRGLLRITRRDITPNQTILQKTDDTSYKVTSTQHVNWESILNQCAVQIPSGNCLYSFAIDANTYWVTEVEPFCSQSTGQLCRFCNRDNSAGLQQSSADVFLGPLGGAESNWMFSLVRNPSMDTPTLKWWSARWVMGRNTGTTPPCPLLDAVVFDTINGWFGYVFFDARYCGSFHSSAPWSGPIRVYLRNCTYQDGWLRLRGAFTVPTTNIRLRILADIRCSELGNFHQHANDVSRPLCQCCATARQTAKLQVTPYGPTGNRTFTLHRNGGPVANNWSVTLPYPYSGTNPNYWLNPDGTQWIAVHAPVEFRVACSRDLYILGMIRRDNNQISRFSLYCSPGTGDSSLRSPDMPATRFRFYEACE